MTTQKGGWDYFQEGWTTDNELKSESQSGSVTSYGNYPNTLYVDASGSAGTNDNDVVYTANDVSMYNTHYVECTAGTVDVDVSIDGTNWIAAVVGRNIATTGVFTQVNEAASGVCLEIIGKYRKLRVNQKGATASNARIAHTVA